MLSVENPGKVVAGWNANLSFSQGQDRERQNNAFRYVEAMGSDIDILCTPELMDVDSSKNKNHLATIHSRFADLGFTDSLITSGVRPDELQVGLWSKQPYEGGFIDLGTSRRQPQQPRNLPYVEVPGLATVIGIHKPSDDEHERVEIAERIVDHITDGSGKPEDMKSTIIVGDFNAGRAGDGRNAFIFHLADYFLRVIPKLVEIDYQSDQKLVHLAGVAIRASAMSRGGTMKVYRRAGLIDADPSAEPTVFHNMPLLGKLRVDHMLASPDIEFSNYLVMPRSINDEDPVSDHSGLRASVRNTRWLETKSGGPDIDNTDGGHIRFAA